MNHKMFDTKQFIMYFVLRIVLFFINFNLEILIDNIISV